MAAEVERYIRIQYLVPGSANDDRPGEWRTLPNGMRVGVWHLSIVDALADDLADNENPKRFIFHVNYMDGVVRGCRVSYLGQTFTVLGVSDSTRLRGLELRCAPLA
jgi:hypothetical protein